MVIFVICQAKIKLPLHLIQMEVKGVYLLAVILDRSRHPALSQIASGYPQNSLSTI